MTAPVLHRMPDPFSPGAAVATAATPTCCCCCCCVASTVTASVALHTGLLGDLPPAGTPAAASRFRPFAPVVAMLVWLALVLAAVLVTAAAGWSEDFWGYQLGGLVLGATAAVTVVDRLAGSRKVGGSARRLLFGAAFFGCELFLGGMALLFYGSYLVIGPVAAAFLGVFTYRLYRRRP